MAEKLFPPGVHGYHPLVIVPWSTLRRHRLWLCRDDFGWVVRSIHFSQAPEIASIGSGDRFMNSFGQSSSFGPLDVLLKDVERLLVFLVICCLGVFNLLREQLQDRVNRINQKKRPKLIHVWFRTMGQSWSFQLIQLFPPLHMSDIGSGYLSSRHMRKITTNDFLDSATAMCGFFTMTWNRHGGNPLLGNPCQFRHPTTPTPGTGHAFAAALAKVPSSSGAAEVPWEWWHIWSLKGWKPDKTCYRCGASVVCPSVTTYHDKKNSLQSLKGGTAKKYAMISKIAFVVWSVHSFSRFLNLLNPHFVLPNLYFLDLPTLGFERVLNDVTETWTVETFLF